MLNFISNLGYGHTCWHMFATLGGANLNSGVNLHPEANLHPSVNCAYEHSLSAVVSKLQPSVCGLPWPDPESFNPPPLSCLDLIIQHEKSVIHNGQLKHSDLS